MAWPVLTDALITTEVRMLLGEPTARRISDAEIVRWINQGMMLITRRNRAAMATARVTLTANTYIYSATTLGMTDCVAVRAVFYMGGTSATIPVAGGTALLRMDARHFSNIQASTAGAPLEYIWFANNLYLWPLPSSSTNKILVFYHATDEAISSDGFAGILPFHYGPYLIWYAYSQALMKIGKPEQSLQYMSYFDNFILYHRDSDGPWAEPDSADTMSQLPDRTEFIGG